MPDYEDRLSKFERMCVVKAFREDRTLVAAADYISDALGQRFVESVPLSMERAWAESHRKCPLICLLSPGSDPTKLIEDLAKKKKIKTLGVSMGQGQEVIARKFMATATVEGQWVLLQNTHLGLSYLTELEQYLAKAEELHEDFRWGWAGDSGGRGDCSSGCMGGCAGKGGQVGSSMGLTCCAAVVTQAHLAAKVWRPRAQLAQRCAPAAAGHGSRHAQCIYIIFQGH